MHHNDSIDYYTGIRKQTYELCAYFSIKYIYYRDTQQQQQQ